MAFTEALPVWNAAGIEPPQSLKDAGWGAGDYPAAGHMNYNLHRAYLVLKELQEESASTEWVTQQLAAITIPLVDSNTSTSKTSAPTADALRVTTELAKTKMDAARPSNLLPNSSAAYGFTGYTQSAAGGWMIRKSTDTGVSTFAYGNNPASAVNLTSAPIPVVSGTYNASVEFYGAAVAAGEMYVQILDESDNVLATIQNAYNDKWARRNADFVVGPTVYFVRFRMNILTGSAQVYRAFRKAQITFGAGVQPWNDDSDAIARTYDYVRQPGYATTGGTGTAYTVTLDPAPLELTDGFTLTIVPHTDNNSYDPSLKINTFPAAKIRRANGTEFYSGTIKAGAPLTLVRVGSVFLAKEARLDANSLDDTTSSTDKTKAATADALRRVKELADTKMDANRYSNLLPNSTGLLGLTGWTVNGGGTWNTQKDSNEAPSIFLFPEASGSSYRFIESDPIPVFSSTYYNASAEFYAVGLPAGSIHLEIARADTKVPFASVQSGSGDNWVRRNGDITIPAGVTSVVLRLVVNPNVIAGSKAFRRAQLTLGSGARSWNDDSDGYTLFQSVSNGKTSLKTAVTGKGGTVAQAGSVPTFAELVTGVNSISQAGKTRVNFSNAFVQQNVPFTIVSLPAGLKKGAALVPVNQTSLRGITATQGATLNIRVSDGVNTVTLPPDSDNVLSLFIDVATKTAYQNGFAWNSQYSTLTGSATSLSAIDFSRPITVQIYATTSIAYTTQTEVIYG